MLVYIFFFLLVCFLLRDRLGERMGEALSDFISTIVWLAVLAFLYLIFAYSG